MNKLPFLLKLSIALLSSWAIIIIWLLLFECLFWMNIIPDYLKMFIFLSLIPLLLAPIFYYIFHNKKEISPDLPQEYPKDENPTNNFQKEFLSNLAHELKTPLFSIQGYILTLLEGAMENPETNKRFLKKAAKATDRMTSLIKDLDYLTKIEVNQITLEKTTFYIHELCKEIFESLESLCKEKNISFSITSKDPTLMVLADRNKIGQVLTNLLMNSISYNVEGGKTVVTILKVKSKVKITIEDNGPGIDDVHLSRLFERFYRVEKSRNRNKGGSGIGLSIVKHILNSHGQEITVKSKIEKGTKFSFFLDISKGGKVLYSTLEQTYS